ncbi:putative ferric reductase, NAD binding domain, ferric reductase transmembrane component-like protein [Septoria linicola]|nr:putative ferric reductase, NAD binding domain, ferric reductase transmembrane component-like protein [Septoria linicola]
MDEMMHMGTPWLDKPLSETYRMYECQFNDTQLCDYQQGYWRFWYEADHRYALPTVALFLSTIILFSIAYVFDQFGPRTIKQSKPGRRIAALNRYLSYKTYRISPLDWNSAPLGLLVLGGIGLIYFLCMTLAPQPYYWPDTAEFGSSPPIATRAGWLSLACMPFVFATAGKSNLITLATGVSHEKLQIFHRWISYAFFVTALVHTFPFIIYNIKTGTMTESWNTLVFYWTGVVALVAQAWLTFASLSPLRSLSYEWFKFSHFVAALVFVLFLFFHCDHTLSSWDYFIATGVLFSLSWLHRQVRLYFEHGVNHRANISLTSNGFICARIPTTSTWTIGQHFFVRFMSLGVHASTNHPFTACSLPVSGSFSRKLTSELVLYIRPRGGTTARLAKFAEAHPNSPMRVVLDGPYGGIDLQKILACPQQLVVAGGSGAGWIMPLLSAFLLRQPLAGSSTLSIKVVLATREAATRGWFEDAVRDLLAEHEIEKLPEGLDIDLYFTGSQEQSPIPRPRSQISQQLNIADKVANVTNNDLAHAPDSDTSSDPARMAYARHFDHRPDLPAIIKTEATQSPTTGQLGVFVCGPLSMQSDVSTAVAAEQLAIVRGGPKDIYLHMEHFSWA